MSLEVYDLKTFIDLAKTYGVAELPIAICYIEIPIKMYGEKTIYVRHAFLQVTAKCKNFILQYRRLLGLAPLFGEEKEKAVKTKKDILKKLKKEGFKIIDGQWTEEKQ